MIDLITAIMPQRFLRPGITNSKKWNSVSWQAQSLFIRLITIVDDFGCCDGRVAVVWGNCFAIWNEENPQLVVELQQVAQMLQQLADKELLECYEADGKKVIQLTDWQERIRDGVKRKWPVAATSARLAAKNGLLEPSSLSRTIAIASAPTNAVEVVEEIQNRLGVLFKRPKNGIWTYGEQSQIAEIARHPDALMELSDLERFAKRPGSFFPKSVASLLNKWSETLDRARLYAETDTKLAAGPPKPEVMKYAEEKWGDDHRHIGWAVQFHRYWTEKGWKKNGRNFDWQEELTRQVSLWRGEK